MESKFNVIWNLLFKNITYSRYYPISNIEEKTISPLVILGRTIVTKEESENISDDVIFRQAYYEIFKSEHILSSVNKTKINHLDNNGFLSYRHRVVYEVKLTVIPNM